MRRPLLHSLLLAISVSLAIGQGAPASAQVGARIKDIADFEGVRENLLVGYGLVVGLNGTGDSLNNAVFTRQSLVAMLERLGVNTRDTTLKTGNVAAVMVTAVLPPFARQGQRIDLNISSLGDAKSLQGGTLLVTPLLGADAEVYAVGQGPVAVAGFAAGGRGTSVIKNVPTTGKIASGAIVERELDFRLADLENMRISLRNPDFTTARRIAQAINAFLGVKAAEPEDPATVRMRVPATYDNSIVSLLTDVEQLRVEPDQTARIVIDDVSGVIVMGENVRISTVAIAQGNLTIRITETPQVSQPAPFSATGTTTTVDRTQVEIEDDGDRRLGVLRGGITLQELVTGLNALGIGPRDLIAILQSIKAAGALQAEIKVM